MRKYVPSREAPLPLLLLLGLAVSFAQLQGQPAGEEQEAEAPQGVQLGAEPAWGEFLVDEQGRSLYIYTEDEPGAGESVCFELCASNWPPFTPAGEPALGEGVDPELLGAFERADGETQVTYAGWPLYYSARDAEAGHTRGQMIGGSFFLITSAGDTITEEREVAAVEVDEEEMAQLMEAGEQSYIGHCQVCHGDQGQGGIGPALAGNSLVGDADFLVARIIEGFPDHGMPPFGHLSDEEIAAVATFTRNAWGNEFGPVVSEQVEEHR